MTKPRNIKPLTIAELEKLTTARLLAYLKKLNECEESLELSDWTKEEIISIEGIIFKSSNEWQEQYTTVKSILSKRPHIK